MESIVDLIAAIDDSEMDSDVKQFIKNSAQLFAEGKGVSAQDGLLESIVGEQN